MKNIYLILFLCQKPVCTFLKIHRMLNNFNFQILFLPLFFYVFGRFLQIKNNITIWGICDILKMKTLTWVRHVGKIVLFLEFNLENYTWSAEMCRFSKKGKKFLNYSTLVYTVQYKVFLWTLLSNLNTFVSLTHYFLF